MSGRSGHNPRYDSGVDRLVAGYRNAAGPSERKHSSGTLMADGCWSCEHYGNFRPSSGGTPPWSVCRFDLDHPQCGRWSLSNQPWRYDENWRDTAISAALGAKP